MKLNTQTLTLHNPDATLIEARSLTATTLFIAIQRSIEKDAELRRRLDAAIKVGDTANALALWIRLKGERRRMEQRCDDLIAGWIKEEQD